jgi:beta-lactamase regulating signal transducer with metallopeptidase domain
MGSLILRSIGIAAIAGICVWKIRNVAVRHAIWVAVLGALVLMPVVDDLLPATWVPVRIQKIASDQPIIFRGVSVKSSGVPQILVSATPAAESSMPAQSNPVDWWRVAAVLYALVAFAMFTRLAMGYRKIWTLRRTGTTIASSVWESIVTSHRNKGQFPVLLESESVQVPMTVGFIRPAVILPVDWRSWDGWKMRAVLLHEIAHIRRGDWGIAVIAAIAKCAYWLNPLTWFLERKLSLLAEQASDDASLCRTQNATRYAEILLEFAAAVQDGGRLMKGGVAMAQHKIQGRIERVLGEPQPGTGIVKIAGWALVMFIAVPVLYSAAALQVAPEPVPAPIPTYLAEFGRNSSQVPAATPQTAPQPGPQAQQKSTTPATELQDQLQLQLEKQKLQQNLKVTEQTFQMVQKYNQSDAGAKTEPSNTSDKLATAVYLQEALYRVQLRQLQAELAMREAERARIQQQLVNKPNPNQSQLDQLRVNEAAMERSRAEISSLNRLIEEKRLASPSAEATDSNSKNRVFVTGRVQRPGDLQYDRPLTVLQALALAGGFQEYAKPDAISIIRMNGDSSTLFRFNYSDVIKGVNSSNIYLENGDVVVVP